MAIEPGIALGPVDLGATLDDLNRTGLKVTATQYSEGTGVAEVGPIKVSLCAGKVIDIWMDDLRLAPECVTFHGKKLDRSASLESLQKLIGNCKHEPPAIGGMFERCQDGGVYLGHQGAAGKFIQIRVQPKGYEMRETCARMLDDGSPVMLTERARARVVEQIVTLPKLTPFWHPDTKGRDPLRFVKIDGLSEQPKLKMFGSPIVWIERLEAKPDAPYFEITKMAATRTRLIVSFKYPVEGVEGEAELRPSENAEAEWRVHDSTVKER